MESKQIRQMVDIIVLNADQVKVFQIMDQSYRYFSNLIAAYIQYLELVKFSSAELFHIPDFIHLEMNLLQFRHIFQNVRYFLQVVCIEINEGKRG